MLVVAALTASPVSAQVIVTASASKAASLMLKQSTARNREIFMASTVTKAGASGLTLTITVSKNGAALTSITPVVTDLGSGLYSLALTSSHTDTLGDLTFHITASGADTLDFTDQVVTEITLLSPTGDGSGLTSLNASQLGSGTVPDARFPATLPAASGVNLTALNGTAISSGTVANARTTATSANTASTIVARDASNNFSAGTITATFAGNATTATALAADGANCGAGSYPLGVDASGAVQNCTAVAGSSTPGGSANQFQYNSAGTTFAGAAGLTTTDGGATVTLANGAVLGTPASGNGSNLTALNGTQVTTGTVANARTTAASTNTASTIVLRDGSGNFSAGTITATFTGNASTATALAANGTNCSAGNYPLGVDASGNVENCTAAATGGGDATVAGGLGQFAASTSADLFGVLSDEIKNGGAPKAIFSDGGLAVTSGKTATFLKSISFTAADDTGTYTLPTGTKTLLATDGSGASLTALNATELGSGTVPDARFPATLPAASGANLTSLPAGNLTGNIACARVPALTGDVTSSAGSCATTLAAGSASNLNSGTLPAGRMPALTGDVTTVAGAVASTLANIPSGVTMAGSELATAIVAPGTPAAGKASIYVDSTSKNLAVKNDAGTVSHGVQTQTSVSNQWIKTITDAGAVTTTQPAFTDISGSVASTQMPALSGDISTSAGATVTTIGASKVTSGMIVDGTIVNADVNGSAAIDDTKLATIATAGKVSNSATTAVTAATANTIALRDSNGALGAVGLFNTYRTVAASASIALTDGTVECITNAQTQTLPTAVGITGRIFVISNWQTANTCTLAAFASQTVGGVSSMAVLNGSVTVQSDGANFRVLTSSGADCGSFVSGGIPYFSSTGSCASSALLAANNLVVGGGAGAAPATVSVLPTAMEPAHTGDVTNSAGSLAMTLANIPSAVPMAGSLLATAITAPGTPASGKGSIYVDSTSKNLAVKDDAGVVKHGAQTKTVVSNQFFTAFSDAGAFTSAQPAFTDISGSVASTQMPALTGDVTTSAGAVATTIGAGKVVESMLGFSAASTTKDATTTTHGLLPILDNNSAHFLNGQGNWAVATGAVGCTTGGSATQVVTDDGATGCTSNAGFLYASGVATLGVNNTTRGKVKLFGNTSGDATIQPTSAAGTATVITLPASSTTMAGIDIANTYSTGAQDFTSATSLKVPARAGYAPTATGSIGYDTTKNCYVAGAQGALTGCVPLVVSVSRPGGSITNSTTADQDFSSVFTIPASMLVANKVLEVTLTFQIVSGVSSSTFATYLKLGSTKVATYGSSGYTDSLTKSFTIVYQIMGTAAASGSADVEVGSVTPQQFGANAFWNLTTEPVPSIATNGTLTIVPGGAWSATGSTETLTLLSAVVKVLN